MAIKKIILSILFACIYLPKADSSSTFFGLLNAPLKDPKTVSMVASCLACAGTVLAGTMYYRASDLAFKKQKDELDSIDSQLKQKEEERDRIYLLQELEQLVIVSPTPEASLRGLARRLDDAAQISRRHIDQVEEVTHAHRAFSPLRSLA